jgi:hypothetical protein
MSTILPSSQYSNGIPMVKQLGQSDLSMISVTPLSSASAITLSLCIIL